MLAWTPLINGSFSCHKLMQIWGLMSFSSANSYFFKLVFQFCCFWLKLCPNISRLLIIHTSDVWKEYGITYLGIKQNASNLFRIRWMSSKALDHGIICTVWKLEHMIKCKEWMCFHTRCFSRKADWISKMPQSDSLDSYFRSRDRLFCSFYWNPT